MWRSQGSPVSCFLEAGLFSISVDSVRYSGILIKYPLIKIINKMYRMLFGMHFTIMLFLTCFFPQKNLLGTFIIIFNSCMSCCLINLFVLHFGISSF